MLGVFFMNMYIYIQIVLQKHVISLTLCAEFISAERGSYEKVRDQCCTEGGLIVLNNTGDDVTGGGGI